MNSSDDTQPIGVERTLVFQHPGMETEPPAQPQASRKWGLLYGLLAAALLGVGVLLGAFLVAQATYTPAEVDQHATQVEQEAYQDGYDDGQQDAEDAAKGESDEAYQDGYDQGFRDGQASVPTLPDLGQEVPRSGLRGKCVCVPRRGHAPSASSSLTGTSPTRPPCRTRTHTTEPSNTSHAGTRLR